MGLFYWGEENNPNRQDAADDSPSTRRVRVSDVSHNHSPDKRGERTDRYGKQPIEVKRGWLGGYKVIDGNDRLHYARERGDEWIDAEVWD
jgi:hypothetical protein